MSEIAEKRVFGDRLGAREAYVASGAGLVRVRLRADAIGEFALLDRRPARDLVVDDGTIAVATAEDVLVGAVADVRSGDGDSKAETDAVHDGGPFAETGLGPAVAVGADATGISAATSDGALSRLVDGDWRSIDGPADLAVRAIDGELVGTDRGVYRLRNDSLAPAGLADVRDVSVRGPWAATGSGLYALGNGWMRTLEPAVDVVAVEPVTFAGEPPTVHAGAGSRLLERRVDACSGRDGNSGATGDASGSLDDRSSPAEGIGDADRTDGWTIVAEFDAPIVDVAHAEAGYSYVATADGRLHAVGPDGVRSRSIGVPDLAAVVVLDGS